MTITLGSFAQMLADAQTASTQAARDRLSSVITVSQWMFTAADGGDMVLGFWRLGKHKVRLILDVSDENGSTVYRVRLELHDRPAVWDVAAQALAEPAGPLKVGKDMATLMADSRITGNIVAALNEVEKARAAVEALIP